MKDKNVAGILALFLGWLGIHRFYLGQGGLGVAYLIFSWTPVIWIISFIDAISFFMMDKENFDRKYNRRFMDDFYLERDTDFDRRRARSQSRKYRRERRREERGEYGRPRPRQMQSQKPQPRKKPNPYKKRGIEKYRDYDYDGAIEDFIKALEIDPTDIATHFNIACAYSLNEDTDKAFEHLDKAVALGFKDFQKLKEHDALAYIRIQDEFDKFEKNGFRLVQTLQSSTEDEKEEDILSTTPDLLDQLNKLGELKDKGLLTEEEFVSQKRKLLG